MNIFLLIAKHDKNSLYKTLDKDCIRTNSKYIYKTKRKTSKNILSKNKHLVHFIRRKILKFFKQLQMANTYFKNNLKILK